MTQTPEQIAAGLSKAQREAIDRLATDGMMSERYADMRTIYALDRKRLTSGYVRDYDQQPMITITTLGQQVRAILKEQTP